MDGHSSLKLAATLANSFKHRDGILDHDSKCKFDEHWEKVFGDAHGYKVDDRIKYEILDFSKLVSETEKFCKKAHDLLVDRMEPKNSIDS